MYIDNDEVLREIHLSKYSYCWFLRPEYSHFDLVVGDLSEVDRRDIVRRQPLGPWMRPPEPVVRVRDFSHIPPEYIDGKTGRPRLRDLRFVPFRHFALRLDGSVIEVGRSHWKGDPETGCFSCDHGRLTDRLVRILEMLVRNYSRRSNWRGYTWIDDMRSEALANLAEAALKFDEGVSNNPFGYYTRVAQNAFRGVLAREDRQLAVRDMIMEANGYSPRFDTQAERDIRNNAVYYGDAVRVELTEDVIRELREQARRRGWTLGIPERS